MSASPLQPHLVPTPPGTGRRSRTSHTVQFYTDDESLIHALAGFVGGALVSGDSALVVATPAHRRQLQARLAASGFDVDAAAGQGRFLQLDAAETLSGFMMGGWPDGARFRATIGPVFEQLKSRAATGTVAVFGEMVALLWHEGKHQAAIRLEQLWNEFCEAQPLRLRCAYPLDEFSRNDPDQQLQQVCGEHTHIVSSESFSTLATEQQRLRSVAVLQQKADALDTVLAERASLALALAEEVDELRRLHELSTKVSWLDLQHVMREVVAAVAALHKTDMGLLALHHSERHELQLEASIGFPPRFLDLASRIPPGAAACGACGERGEPVIVEDVETDPVFEGYREAARSAGFRALYSAPLLDRSGHMVGVLSLHFRQPHRPGEREIRLTDLYTRLAGAAIENARLSRALLQAEKLAATGRMAATIAHEINNPLESVVNLLYILRSYVRDEAAARHYLSLAESELSRVSQITKQTLGFYRERLAPEAVNLPELLDSVLGIFARRIAEKRIVVVRRDQPCSVVGVKGELRQLFSNLVDNAIAAVPKGGRIDLSISQDGAAGVVCVADDGGGIPPSNLPRLFEPFFTTKQHLGTGLGLWVAKEIVEKHRGDIVAESDTDPARHGTRFTVRIAGMAPNAGEAAR